MTIDRVFMLIRSLNCGGAERQFVLLAKELAARGMTVTAATYYPGGAIRHTLAGAAGVRLVDLRKRGRWDLLGFVRRLRAEVRRTRPDVVYAVSSCGGLFATAATAGMGVRTVWTLRDAKCDVRYRDPRAALIRLAARASRFADGIIVNSHQGLADYAEIGFPRERMVVIPNGVDHRRFAHDSAGRRRVRSEWGVSDDECLVGRVGRFDPVKDLPTFIRAASLTRTRRMRFVVVGDGSDDERSRLRVLVDRHGLSHRWVWAGMRDDMPAVYSALDLACSSSTSEGCPNVVVEAMACGVASVVTDVGDSAWIVGDTGPVVPPGDASRMADAMDRWAARTGPELAQRVRARVHGRFAVQQLVDRTVCALEGVSC